MIRYIDITDQVFDFPEGILLFSWYNTVTDQFLMYDHTNTWSSWEEFEMDHNMEENSYEIERFKRLYRGII